MASCDSRVPLAVPHLDLMTPAGKGFPSPQHGKERRASRGSEESPRRQRDVAKTWDRSPQNAPQRK